MSQQWTRLMIRAHNRRRVGIESHSLRMLAPLKRRTQSAIGIWDKGEEEEKTPHYWRRCRQLAASVHPAQRQISRERGRPRRKRFDCLRQCYTRSVWHTSECHSLDAFCLDGIPYECNSPVVTRRPPHSVRCILCRFETQALREYPIVL